MLQKGRDVYCLRNVQMYLYAHHRTTWSHKNIQRTRKGSQNLFITMIFPVNRKQLYFTKIKDTIVLYLLKIKNRCDVGKNIT